MFKHIKIYGLLSLALANNLQASEISYDLTLSGITCQKQGQDCFTLVDDEITTNFYLQKGDYVDGKLTFVFMYEWEGVRYKEILKGSCTADPLKLILPNYLTYGYSNNDFKLKLNDYLGGLTRKNLKITRKGVWKADKKLPLENGKCWVPIIYFCRIGNATFFKWDLLVDKESHRTKIQTTYRFNNEELIGKIDIYDCKHYSKLSQAPTLLTCGQDYHLREIKSIIWNTIPDSRKSWATDNGIKDEEYESLEYSSSIGKILECPIDLHSSSFNLIFQKYLPSKYIFINGTGNSFMTQVKEYLRKGSTQKVKVLHETSYPLILNKNSQYRNGFYYLDTTQKIGGIIQEVWRQDETLFSIFKCTDSLFTIADLTDTLLRMNDTDIFLFIECFKNFQPLYETESIKTLKMRIAGLQLDEKKKATDRLWQIRNPLLSNNPQRNLQLDCDELHFGEVTLSNADLIYLKSQNIAKDRVSGSLKIEFSDRDNTLFYLSDSWKSLMEFPNLKPSILDLSDLSDFIVLDKDLIKHIQGNTNLTELNLIGTKIGDPSTVYQALAKANHLKKIHLNKFDSSSIDYMKWDDKSHINTFVCKLRSLDSLLLPRLSYAWGDYIRAGIQNNSPSLTSLDVSGAVYLHMCENRFVPAVCGLKNLVELNVLNTNLSNMQTCDLIESLSKTDSLKTLKITMPYYVSEHIGTLDLVGRDLLRNDVGSSIALILVVAIGSPIMALGNTLGDISGIGVSYITTCHDLAQIPNLSNLTLQLWGMRKYPDWTREKINNDRRSKERAEIKIDFVD